MLKVKWVSHNHSFSRDTGASRMAGTRKLLSKLNQIASIFDGVLKQSGYKEHLQGV